MVTSSIFYRQTQGLDANGFFYRYLYRVFGAATPQEALDDPDVPTRGDALPSDPFILCDTVEASSLQDSGDTYEVTAVYRRAELVENEQPIDIDRPRTEARTEIIPVWRLNADPPLDINDPDQATDIGGDRVDERGEPVDLPIVTWVEAFTIIRAQPFDRAKYLTAPFAPSPPRNLNAFGPYPAGTVLYLPPTAEPTGADQDQITLRFAVDPAAHLRQKALYTPEGEVLTEPAESPPGTTNPNAGRAKTVVWYQPFPDLYDFALLLT